MDDRGRSRLLPEKEEKEQWLQRREKVEEASGEGDWVMRIVEEVLGGLRMEAFESIPHLMVTLVYPQIQVYPEPWNQRYFPTKWGKNNGFV